MNKHLRSKVPKGLCLFLAALLIQLLTAFWYWEHQSLPWERFGILSLDAAGKSLTAVLSMALLEKIWDIRHTSALFLSYTVLLYNQNSILKFSVDQLFDGYLRNSGERLLGGFLVDLAILLGIAALYGHVRSRKRCCMKMPGRDSAGRKDLRGREDPGGWKDLRRWETAGKEEYSGLQIMYRLDKGQISGRGAGSRDAPKRGCTKPGGTLAGDNPVETAEAIEAIETAETAEAAEAAKLVMTAGSVQSAEIAGEAPTAGNTGIAENAGNAGGRKADRWDRGNIAAKSGVNSTAGSRKRVNAVLIGLLAAGGFAVIRIASLALTGRPITQVTGRTMRTVWEALTNLVYLSCVLAWEEGNRGQREEQEREERERDDREREEGKRSNRDEERNSERKSEGEREREARLTRLAIPVLPLLMVGLVQCLTTLCTGSKQYLAGFALYGLLALLVTGSISVQNLTRLLILSPLVLCLLTGVSEKTSRRLYGYPDRFVMQYHAFRYDLSDLAVTIAERQRWKFESPADAGLSNSSGAVAPAAAFGKTASAVSDSAGYRDGISGWQENTADQIQVDEKTITAAAATTISRILPLPFERSLQEGLRVVREALEMSVPEVFFGSSGKPTELIAYQKQLSRIGLHPERDDYNDTPFSMGAQLLGYPGIFLVLPALLLAVDVMGKAMERRLLWVTRESAEWSRRADPTRACTITLLLCLPYALQAEGDWFMWIYRTRDFLLEMSCVLVLIGIAERIRGQDKTGIETGPSERKKGETDSEPEGGRQMSGQGEMGVAKRESAEA